MVDSGWEGKGRVRVLNVLMHKFGREGRLRVGDIKEGIKLKEMMERMNVLWDVVTYSALID
ncbi:hypothetical protein Droror1_Dr00020341, partial [Drosera rotundifolia]